MERDGRRGGRESAPRGWGLAPSIKAGGLFAGLFLRPIRRLRMQHRSWHRDVYGKNTGR